MMSSNCFGMLITNSLDNKFNTTDAIIRLFIAKVDYILLQLFFYFEKAFKVTDILSFTYNYNQIIDKNFLYHIDYNLYE